MRYLDGTNVKLGDKVTYNNQKGTIVFLKGTSFDAKRFKPDEWTSVGSGLLIEFENGALLKLKNASDQLLQHS
jgi:hypothetical protein